MLFLGGGGANTKQQQQQPPWLVLGGSPLMRLPCPAAMTDGNHTAKNDDDDDYDDTMMTTTSTTTTSTMSARRSTGAPVHWRTLVDNMVVELLSSLFVNLATVLCWTKSTTDLLQFMPAAVLALVLVCIKDEDYFFPDTLPTVTFVLWALGGYTWIHVVARLTGQIIGFGLSAWICLYAVVPVLDYRVEQPLPILFALEAIGTTLEHMAVVYVILPLLPPAHVHLAYPALAKKDEAPPLRWGLARVKPKSHHETQAPSNPMVMHAALTFAGLHWCLSRGFCIEMSPLQTLLIAIVRCNYKKESEATYWSIATVSLWGQAVGVLICITYVALFAPRTATSSSLAPPALASSAAMTKRLLASMTERPPLPFTTTTAPFLFGTGAKGRGSSSSSSSSSWGAGRGA